MLIVTLFYQAAWAVMYMEIKNNVISAILARLYKTDNVQIVFSDYSKMVQTNVNIALFTFQIA